MSTVVELRKKQLRDEIAAIESAEKQKLTPLSELQAAHESVNGCERLLNINAARRNDAVAVLEGFQKRAGGLIGPALQKLQQKISLTESDLRSLAAERDEIETNLSNYRSHLANLSEKIEGHPVYRKIRVKQSELIAEAVSLATSSWVSPLSEIHRIIGKIASIASTESSFLASCLAEIRANGLPEIAPRLHGLVDRISPSFISKEMLSNAWSLANDEIRKLTESTARVKVAR
jgi:chromosome segregation ATPase